MAVLAMTQTAPAHGLQPACNWRAQDIRRCCAAAAPRQWLPHDGWLRDGPARDTSWDTTSDSIALDLARQLNAERMVVVKSCAIDPVASLAELERRRRARPPFAGIAAGANSPIDIADSPRRAGAHASAADRRSAAKAEPCRRLRRSAPPPGQQVLRRAAAALADADRAAETGEVGASGQMGPV